MSQIPILAPIYLPGQEPVPPGTTNEERQEMQQVVKYGKWMQYAMESCPLKCTMAGGMGLAMGGFISMMSATFAYEDPLSRASDKFTSTRQQTMFVFKEMGRNMWRSGKGFAKVGALYSGTECCIEGYRARHDMYNAVSAGFISGAVLARSAGPTAMLGGGAMFAAFSAAIEAYLMKDPPDEE